jgi:hypothetical protein
VKIRPISFRDACAFVDALHRHHKRPQGHKFSLCLMDGDKVVGVVVVGRPIARKLDDGLTCEVTRLCVDGTKNAASKLYAAARRVAGAMGYERVITYTLKSEPGSSLRAAGWVLDCESKGGTWSRPSRGRKDKHPIEAKNRWSSQMTP